MDKPQLLTRLDARWQDLVASYADLSASEMNEPGVTGTWSVKDIIAHVSVWEEEALTHLPDILAGRKPPRYSVTHGGINAFNAQMTQRDRGLPLAEVLRRRDDMHRRLLRFIQHVPAPEFGSDTRFRRRLRLDTYGHYAVHTRAILKWRELRRPRPT
jgi:DinB superfamily